MRGGEMTQVDTPPLGSSNGDVVGEHKAKENAYPASEPLSKSLTLDPIGTGDGGQQGGCWQVRYTLAILALIGIALMYAMRVILSIAIVAMVGSRSEASNKTHAMTNVCPDPKVADAGVSDHLEGEFEWEESIQGVILASFFWGYSCTNIVGGRAAEYLGGKLVFGLGIVLSALLTVLTPISARTSTELLIAARVGEGLVQGVVFPAINSMLATWIPPIERSRYNTIVFSGFPLGTVLSLPVGGWLCSSHYLGGWPSAFYLFGSLGLIWGVAWFLLVHDRPEKHPRISDEELAHLNAFKQDTKRAEVVALPWKDFLMSLPFWGLMLGALGYDFGFYTFLTELPTYLKNIQHFDMNENGMMSALPFLVMWLWGYVWGSFMDRLTAAKKVSIIVIRRISMSLAMYGPMLGLMVMCFVNCNTVLAMVVLCMGVGLAGSANCGFLCSHQDLAPNFAGTLLGFTNTLGSFAGIIAPIITGRITDGNQTLSAWRTIFLITVAFYFVTCTFYIVFISERTQHWNEPKSYKYEKDFHGCLEAQLSLESDDSRHKLSKSNNLEEC
ncbi:sialin-like isoform X2 [Panulirus ornatus]|uniref:sialin-like isoform X2 n=2 Tax=Panulirus ornatus TaxID=150431 RepID=UPI003A83C7E3